MKYSPGEIIEITSAEIGNAINALQHSSGKPNWWPGFLWRLPKNSDVFNYCLMVRGYIK